MKWAATILGQPVSKANSRRFLRGRNGTMISAKSQKACDYSVAVGIQAQACAPPRLLEGRLKFSGTLYYRSERPDLDPSVLVDSLEGIVFENDRQVRHWDIGHGIDKQNPRAEIVVEEMEE